MSSSSGYGQDPRRRPGTESSGWAASGGQRFDDSPPEPALDPDPSLLISEEFAEAEGVPPLAPDDPVAVAEREREEFRDGMQRLQADFENYRKRVAKQTEEIRERAAESLVTQLLPVLDTADLALSHGGGEDIKQLSVALFAVLEKEGLQRIDNAGEPFDPNCHDAVAHEPGDGGGGQEVAEVMRAGYRWRGRVIRAAMVKVRG
ncbi:MAG: nucleotide exchange factor GrpE [Actinomycetota bacterium]|nr:nucleotide exchange factor GrpE [Actinomycetota bacterium]